MAYVEIIPIKASILATLEYMANENKTSKKLAELREAEPAIDTDKLLQKVYEYATRPDKTTGEEQLFVSGINCDIETAVEEFLEVQRAFGKTDRIRSHHGWQSFKAGTAVTPELVHQIGVELAQNFWGDRFQVVVTTHLDRAHLHNHFLVNSVSFVDGKKYPGNLKSLAVIRRLSDELCLKYGLPIIENPKRGGTSKYAYRVELNGKRSWRDFLMADIDEALLVTSTFDEFCQNMQMKGYLIKNGKHFAMSPPGLEREGKRAYIRLKSLKNDDYTLEGIKRRLADKPRGIRITGVKSMKIKRTQLPKKKLPYYMAIYYRYMYSLGLLKKKPKNISWYNVRKEREKAKQIVEKINYIKGHKLRTKGDRDKRLAFLNDRIQELERKRKFLYNTKYRQGGSNSKELPDLKNELSELKRERKICASITVIRSTADKRKTENRQKPETKDVKETQSERKTKTEEGVKL